MRQHRVAAIVHETLALRLDLGDEVVVHPAGVRRWPEPFDALTGVHRELELEHVKAVRRRIPQRGAY